MNEEELGCTIDLSAPIPPMLNIQHVTKLVITQSAYTIAPENQQIDFGEFLSELVSSIENLNELELSRIREQGLFSHLQLHPEESSIQVLRLKYLDIDEEDMVRVGPCFPNVSLCEWRMNRFDEAYY